MILVVDASAAIKWFLSFKTDETDADRALLLLEGTVTGNHTLVQPPHFVAEVAAVLAQEKPRDAVTDMANLDEIPFERAESSGLYTHAIALAVRHGHHLFDTL